MNCTIRQTLREATAERHRRLDAALGVLDLADRHDYRRLLNIHARVAPALEACLAERTLWSGWRARSPDLIADLADLDQAPPVWIVPMAEAGEAAAWGLQYVLEGARLGARVLSAQVGPGLPRRYLADPPAPDAWRRFQTELDASIGAGSPTRLATEAAKLAFDLFDKAARLEGVGV